jgi:hypothetical protein
MIIGICGECGAGKSQIGRLLRDYYGYQMISYSNVLKSIVAYMFSWDRNMIEGTTKESREWREKPDEWWSERLGIPDFTPRKALQMIGTDVMRNHFHSEIWLACLERKLQHGNYVITDCRFKNELDFVKKMGGKIFMVRRLGTETEPKHESEMDWRGVIADEVIDNDGSLEDLDVLITETMRKYGK